MLALCFMFLCACLAFCLFCYFMYRAGETLKNDREVALAFEELRFFSERFEILGVYPADPFRARV